MLRIRVFALLLLCLTGTDASAVTRQFFYSVDAEIDDKGVVVSADVIHEDITAEFEAAVIHQIKQWRIQPATRDGKAVAVSTSFVTEVNVEFRADKSASISARYVSHGPRNATNLPPRYPTAALRSGMSAEVAVLVEVAESGKPIAIRTHSVRTTHDDARSARAFLAETIKVVKRWTFKPELIDGRPVSGEVLVPVKFTVDGEDRAKWFWSIPPAATTDPSLLRAQAVINAGADRPIGIASIKRHKKFIGIELISDGSKS